MSLRDELQEKGYPFVEIPSIKGGFRGDIGWEITGLTEDGRDFRHILSVAEQESAISNLTDDCLFGPGIIRSIITGYPSFSFDRNGKIVGIWALIKQED